MIPRLSVIIPAYNEARSITATLEDVCSYLQRQDYDAEVLVVNDGSKDATAEIARSAASSCRMIRVIDNRENKGKGGVVKQGMLAARGSFRLFMDADNATSVDQVEGMWPKVEEGCSIVIGSRDLKGSVLDPPQPWWRRVLGDVFNLGVQALSGLWGIWDTQCGFKGFTAEAAQAIFSRSRITWWTFDVEALVIAKRHGFRVAQIPVHWVNNQDSKVRVNVRGMIRALAEVVTIRRNAVRGVYD